MKIEIKDVKSVAISDYSIFESDSNHHNLFATEWINQEGIDITLEGDSSQHFSLSYDDIKAINEATKLLRI